MPELWDALHNTYNSAADRPCDLLVLDKLLDIPAQEWAPFSALELMEALATCSSFTSPGPDHVTWLHLKKIIAESQRLHQAGKCLPHGWALAKTFQGVGLSDHTEAWQALLLRPKGVQAHCAPEHLRETHREDAL